MKTKHIKPLFFTVILLSCLDGFAQTSESDILRNIEVSRLKALVDNDISRAASLHADNFELIDLNFKINLLYYEEGICSTSEQTKFIL